MNRKFSMKDFAITKMSKFSNNQALESKLKFINTNNKGLHSCVRWTFLFARIMGINPLTGVMASNSGKLRFTFVSPYSIYYVLSILGQFLSFTMSTFWLLQNGITLANISNSIFYTSALVSVILLSHIGSCWSKFIVKVEEIENQLPSSNRNLARICNSITCCVLFFALVEHALSVFYGWTVAKACNHYDIGQSYFKYSMPWIFGYTDYSWWKGIVIEIFNIQSTFMWSYNDLLIMIISFYLSEHLVVHYGLLKKALELGQFSCAEFRKQHFLIVRLVKLFNKQIGVFIITSFAGNLYWICMQLFYSLKSNYTGHIVPCQFKNGKEYQTLHGIEHSVYFTYSFSFLVIRTLLVLLFAARVHAKSKSPLDLLYAIPTSNYDIEVQRYINQINYQKVALTGLDFFYVTRTMILSLLGTIITYELVLLQYNK